MSSPPHRSKLENPRPQRLADRSLFRGGHSWLALLTVLLLNAGAAVAATITVTTTADNTTANDDECTLREAILNANANGDSTSGDCAAGSAAATDRIVFDLPLRPSTIFVASELPSITDTVEIDGHTDDECTAPIPDRGTYAVALDGSNAGSSDGLNLLGGSDGSTIRGLNIRNFELYGIFVNVSDDHVIECNFLGTDETGSSDQGNAVGILTRKSNGVTFGGTGAGDGNLISGNIEGLHFTSGSDRGGHRIQGNFIGTNKAGTDLLAQSSYGIVIDGGSLDITIGGAEEGAGNLISGNNPGVVIRNTETGGTITFPTTGHLIQGNRIGTDKEGSGDLGNRQAGIVISGASDTTIGGTGAGEGNTIAGNAEGVIVTGDATGVRISGNSIFDNDGVGIDLDDNGRTPNDGGRQDADSGSNNRQNFPVFDSFVRTSSGKMVVSFRIRSSPSHTAYPVTVELFKADSNNGEGRTYLGQVIYEEADADEIVSTSFTSEAPVSSGDAIVATATDAEGNTSEFSSTKTAQDPGSCLTVDSIDDAGFGSLRQAILCANASPGTDTISFDAGPGSYVITPLTELPTITDPVVIDGNLGISGGNPCSFSVAGRSEYRVVIDGGEQSFHGLRLGAGADGSTLKGLNIRGFGGVALLIQESSNNTVACNFIGTNALGTSAAMGNAIGVFIFGSFNTIGGLDSRDGNLISGNTQGINIFGMGSSGNQILGNQVGTDKNGSNAVPNLVGIRIEEFASANQIGGTDPGAGNLISGNSQIGIFIIEGADDNLVAGNSIGTDRSGSGSLGNGLAVAISGGSRNVVGGTEASAGNTIAHSTEDGVEVSNFPGIPSTANRVLGNAIFENEKLGINLVVDSDPTSRVTANDAGDGDGDPNRRQNFPDLLSARLKETFEVRYSVDSTPANAAYPLRVEFYLADVDGQEGRTYLGFHEYTEAAAQSTAKAAFIPTVTPAAGDLILATATDADGNTSEFSPSGVVVEDLRVDLAVTMSESIDPVPAGSADDLVYTVAVVNNGPTTATGVELLDTLLAPAGVIEELVAGGGTSIGPGGTDGEWIWTVGTLAPGAGATLTVRLTVGASAGPGTDVISNSIALSRVDQVDVDASNDSVTEATSIVESVDLEVSITESMDPALPFTGPGGFTYTVTVTNLGPATASGVAVRPTLTLPQGVTLHAITPDRGTFTDPDWSIGSMLPGVVATLIVAMTLDGTVQDGTDALAIAAEIRAVDQHDNDSSNDTASEATSTATVDCFEVTTTADSGPGSLRQAIECANEDPSADTITFGLRGGGPYVISPGDALPTLTSPMVIDGTSQAGSEAACDALTLPSFIHQVVIDGGGGTFSGLSLGPGSDGSQVVGLNIRGFGGSGVDVLGSGGHSIRCNFIGTNEDGTTSLGNSEHGVFLRSGGTLTYVGLNLISGNGIDGVRLTDAGTDGNQIRDNFIGTDQSGTGALGNGARGLQVINGASDNTVSGNLISANVANGVRLANQATSGNLIENNRIGTDASGHAPLGNTSHSISLQSLAELNTIRGNTIAAGANNGVRIDGSSGVLVEENWIGTDASQSSGLGNHASGVILENDSTHNQLRRNTIAFNSQDGIRVLDDGTTGNSFSENRIFSNAQSGIDLSNDGATVNDPGDADLGPNALQNFPQLSRAWLIGPGQLLITYLVDSSLSDSSYPLRVEFFLADDDGEEGMDFVGAVTYDAGSVQGEITEILIPAVAVESGDLVVATATDDLGNTSEFSTSLAVTQATDIGVAIVESIDPVIAGSGPGNLVYTATVTNLGAYDATGVVLTSSLSLPAGVSLESAVPSSGSFSDPTWTLGNLASGAPATLTLTLTVGATAAGGSDVISGGLALSALDQGDAVSANNTAGEATSVVGLSTCFAVTTIDDAGLGSLRQAIECANAVAGPDAISFAIPGTGPHVITPSTALPAITDPVVIDGASQPGNEDVCSLAIADRPAYDIVIDGNDAEFSGLVLAPGSDGSILQGLNIRAFGHFSPSTEGILIDGSSGNTVRCNYIGTDQHGMAARGNSSGVVLENAASNAIGGFAPGDGNLISGNNADAGLFGVTIAEPGSADNVVSGNFIGTDRTGQAALANGNGVQILRAPSTTLGGIEPGAGNVISGQLGVAVVIAFPESADSVIQGNLIGTAADGFSALPNANDGIRAFNVREVSIGGLGPGEGNTIAFNQQIGIHVFETPATRGARIEGNSIFDNTALGIDLNGDGVTANDAGDADTGANKGQNTPVIDAVELAGGGLSVTYHVDSDPANQTYPLQIAFYASDVDGEEGQNVTGVDTYTEADHGGCGTPPCAKSVDLGPFLGPGLVATATDADGNTSEFSATSALPAAEKTVSVEGGGTARPGALLRYTIRIANNGTGPARSVVVTDTPDAKTALVAESGTSSGDVGAAFDYADGVLTATLDGPLPGLGGAVELSFLVEIEPTLGGGMHAVCNQGSVDADGLSPLLTDDPILPGDADVTCVTVDSAPDLMLSKEDGGGGTVGGGTIGGGTIVYSLTYRNTGTSDATGVVLTETVPGLTTFDGATSASGWTCSPDVNAGSICSLSLGSVAAGAQPESVAFGVRVDAALPLGTQEIINTASISDDGVNGLDADPSNNFASVTTAVDPPPFVLAVDTVAATPDGRLTGGESVSVPITQVYIIFSEEIVGADATTSFLVVEAGGDQGISTLSCVHGPQGNDVPVPIVEVSYDNGTARVNLSTGKALPRGRYRMLVCGAAIQDAARQSLDGNGDGAAGGDFGIEFSVVDTGLLDNPNFDQALEPWSSLDFDWSIEDVDDAPTSGSADVVQPGGVRVLEHPCVSVAGHLAFSASLAIRISDPAAASHQAGLALDFFSAAGCSGSALGMSTIVKTLGDTSGAWTSIGESLTVPGGAQSARPSLFFSAGSSSPSEVQVDRVQLTPMLFGDGFESGNTSAWSSTIP